MTVSILTGDCREVLASMPEASVQCVVTSPPYWGAQRDYDVAGQFGMERTPEEFISGLTDAFRLVRRVLKPDGVLWLNMGDSYAASGKGGGGKMMLARGHQWGHRAHLTGWRSPPPGYKQKDLVGVPWKLAEALRSDGWYLRRDVIWSKGSATEPTRADRPCGSHEFVFLMAKAKRYSFDPSPLPHGSVWTVPPKGFPGHPAAFPPDLIEACIKAGSRLGDMILDPFGGAGTTALVADRLQRNATIIELNPEYAQIARDRINGEAGLFAPVAAE
jgi:DNA modification methylase